MRWSYLHMYRPARTHSHNSKGLVIPEDLLRQGSKAVLIKPSFFCWRKKDAANEAELTQCVHERQRVRSNASTYLRSHSKKWHMGRENISIQKREATTTGSQFARGDRFTPTMCRAQHSSKSHDAQRIPAEHSSRASLVSCSLSKTKSTVKCRLQPC